jgi:Sigma-70, region 4
LDEAMGSLGDIDRNTVVLRFFENKTAAEAAAALNLTEAAAHKRLDRALEKLRKFFTRRGVVSTAAAIVGAVSANSVQAAPAALAKSVTAAALAKGTAVSGSTLFLAKGALKLMAWSKAKAAVLATAAVIAAAGTTAVLIEAIHAARAAHYPDLQGAWQGVMLLDEAGTGSGEAARTRIVLRLVKTSNGYEATTDWIDLGRSNYPMGKVVYDYPSLQIGGPPRETWKLTVNEDATKIIFDHAIHFLQPDPVMLTRTSTPDPVPVRLAEAEFTPRPGSDLQGYWKGAIPPDDLPVSVKIAQLPDGTFRAEGDNPMQGANGRPVMVSYSRPKVILSVATGIGRFEGKINNARTEISGLWTQDGQSVPAVIKRADYQAEHAQDAVKDYSFASPNDLQGHWQGTWILPLGGNKLKMKSVLNIAKLPDGKYAAAVAGDLVGYDAPIPASDFQYEPPRVRMKWKWAEVAYEGKLENGKISGTWQQGGGGFPLVYERQP